MTPKFKPGDWVIYEIIDKKSYFVQILDIKYGCYVYSYKNIHYVSEFANFEQPLSFSFKPRLMTDEEKLELL